MPGEDEGLRMFAGVASQVLPPAVQELVDVGDEAGRLHDNREDAEALRRFLWVVDQYETLKADDALSGELRKFTVREMMVRVLFWAGYGLLYRAMGGENGFWPERTSATDPALTRAATVLEECARTLNEAPALRRKVKPWSVHVELANVYACLRNATKSEEYYELALSDAEGDTKKRASTLFRRGRSRHLMGSYLLAIDDSLASQSLGLGNPGIGHYNAACAYALLDRAADAIKALQDAEAVGYRARESARTDSDFDPIRHSPEFQRYMAAPES